MSCDVSVLYLTTQLRLGCGGQQESDKLLAGQRGVVIGGLRRLNNANICGGQMSDTKTHQSVSCTLFMHLYEGLQLFSELFDTKETSLFQHAYRGQTECQECAILG